MTSIAVKLARMEMIGGEARAHPRLVTSGVIDKEDWFIVLHILYPTEKLSFRADLVHQNKARRDTIKVHKFTDSSISKVNESIRVIGVDEGELQILKWEKENVEGNANFVISWKWNDRSLNASY